MKNKTLALLFLGSIVVACSPKVAEVVAEEVPETPEATTEETVVSAEEALAMDGKVIYSANCAKCHDLPIVDSYSKEKWAKIYPSMADNSKLTPSDRATVNAYIQWELAN